MVKKFCIFFLLLVSVNVHAATYYVYKNGSGTDPVSGDTYSAAPRFTDIIDSSVFTTGDIILVAGNDTFTVNDGLDTINITKNSITLKSDAGYKPSIASSTGVYGNSSMVTITADYCLVSGLIFNGSNSASRIIEINTGADSNSVTSCTITRSTEYGILTSGESTYLCNNYIYNNNNTKGVNIDNTNYPYVINNIFDSNSGIGITLANCNFAVVKNNRVSNNKGEYGLELWNVDNSSISNNYIFNNSNDGMRLHGWCDNLTLSNDTAVSNGKHGIALGSQFGGVTSSMVKNEFSCTNTWEGIKLEYCANVTITNCTASGNSGKGIRAADYYSYSCTVQHNIINNNSDFGIHLYYAALFILDDNLSCTNGSAGIKLENCTGIAVANCESDSNGSHGFELWNADTVTLNNNISNSNANFGYRIHGGCYNVSLENEIAANNKQHGIALGSEFSSSGVDSCILKNITSCTNSWEGVKLEYCTDVIITGCSIYGNTSKGIMASQYYSNNCIITGNTVNNNSQYGIALLEIDSFTITDNMLYRNGFSGIYIDTCTNIDIETNSIIQSSSDGIEISKSTGINIANCTSYLNTGNGIYIFNSSDSLNLIFIRVYDNSDGIKIDNSSRCSLTRIITYSNTGSGIAVITADTITGNYITSTENWGGFYSNTGFSSVTAKNSIFYNNTQDIYVENSTETIAVSYSLITSYAKITDRVETSGIIYTGNPKFAESTDSASHTFLKLQKISPCIETGDPADNLPESSDSKYIYTDMGFYPEADVIPPAEVRLVSPADNSSFTSETVTFKWGITADTVTGISASGVAGYILQIDTDLDWTSIDSYIITTDTGRQLTLPISAMAYRWRVLVYDNMANTTTFGGDTFSFTISLPASSYSGPDWYVKTTGSDMTGTGESDTPFKTIYKALTKSTAGNTIILMGDDTFTVNNGSDTIIINTGSLTLKAYTGDKPTIKGSGSNSLITVSSDIFLIRDIILDGSNSAGYLIDIQEGSDSCSVTGCTITGSTSSGIYSSGNYTYLSGNYIYNNNNSKGISIDNADHIYLLYNNIDSNAGMGLSLSNCNFAEINNNTVISSKGNYAIECWNVDTSSVYYNYVSGNSKDGIRLHGGCDNVILSGDTAVNNGNHGIAIGSQWGGADSVIIKNNTSCTNGYEGVKLENCTGVTVTDCKIYGNTFTGIKAADYKSYSCSLLNNSIFNCGGHGISLENSDSFIISGNTIKNSVWKGISLDTASNTVISNNTVTLSGEHGIIINTSSFIEIEYCTVSINTNHGISVNNSDSIIINEIKTYYNRGDGINIVNTDQVSLSRLLIYSNEGGSGIAVINCNYITGNYITSSGHWAGLYSNLTTGNNSFKNSIFYGNTYDVYTQDQPVNLSYSLFQTSSGSIDTSGIILNRDPLFITSSDTGNSGFLKLKYSSPCLNNGDPADSNPALTKFSPYYLADMGYYPAWGWTVPPPLVISPGDTDFFDTITDNITFSGTNTVGDTVYLYKNNTLLHTDTDGGGTWEYTVPITNGINSIIVTGYDGFFYSDSVSISVIKILDINIKSDTKVNLKFNALLGSDSYIIIHMNEADTLTIEFGSREYEDTWNISADFKDTGNILRLYIPDTEILRSTTDTGSIKLFDRGISDVFTIDRTTGEYDNKDRLLLSYNYSEWNLPDNNFRIFYLNPADSKWYNVLSPHQPDGSAASLYQHDRANKKLKVKLRHFSTYMAAPGITTKFLSSNPDSGSISAINASIKIVFTDSVDSPSIQQSFKLYSKSDTLTSGDGIWLWKSDTEFIFLPLKALTSNETYTVLLDGDIAVDINGDSLDGNADNIIEGGDTDNILFSFVTTEQDTYYVSSAGDSSNPKADSTATAYPYIQSALEQCKEGDIIVILDNDTYNESLTIDTNFITIKSSAVGIPAITNSLNNNSVLKINSNFCKIKDIFINCMYTAGTGIELSSTADFNSIQNISVLYSAGDGISCKGDYNSFVSDTVAGCTGSGFYADGCDSLFMKNFYSDSNGSFGFRILDCRNMNLSNNYARYNSNNGLSIVDSKESYLYANYATGNNIGIELWNSSNITLNDLYSGSNNDRGIAIWGSSKNISCFTSKSYKNKGHGFIIGDQWGNTADSIYLYMCIADSNGWEGIKLEYCTQVAICSSIIYNNTFCGIKSEYSVINVKLEENLVFKNNDNGIYLINADSITVDNCQSGWNKKDGIKLENSRNIVLVNDINVSNPGSGLSVNTVSNLFVNFVTSIYNYYGLYWDGSGDITINNSIFYSNTYESLWNKTNSKIKISYSCYELNNGWDNQSPVDTSGRIINDNPYFAAEYVDPVFSSIEDYPFFNEVFDYLHPRGIEYARLYNASPCLDSADPAYSNRSPGIDKKYALADMGAVAGFKYYEAGRKLDDFENDNSFNNGEGSDVKWNTGKYYHLEMEHGTLGQGSSLKVILDRYNKTDYWTGGVIIKLDKYDFSHNTFFTLDVYGKAEFLFKFEDDNGYKEDINKSWDSGNDENGKSFGVYSNYIIESEKENGWNRLRVYYGGPFNRRFKWRGNDSNSGDFDGNGNNINPDGDSTQVKYIRVFINTRKYTDSNKTILYFDNLWLGSGAPETLDVINTVIDNFDNDGDTADAPGETDALWTILNDNYSFNIDTSITFNHSSHSLKINYNNSSGNETQSFAAGNLYNLDNNSLFYKTNAFSINIRGLAEMTAQFEDIDGNRSEIFEPVRSEGMSEDYWSTFKFNYSTIDFKNTDKYKINKIIFHIYPGKIKEGTIYIDNLWLGNAPPVQTGETLIKTKIIAYPNPYFPLENDRTLYFANIPEESIIKIYTLSGDFVNTAENRRWDGHNSKGVTVSSGLYLYAVYYNNRRIGTGKFAIIK